MHGHCVCCGNPGSVDPEDGHCAPCGRGACDHDGEDPDAGFDEDLESEIWESRLPDEDHPEW